MNFRSLPKAQLGLFKTGPIMMPRVISTINTGLNNLVNYFSGEEDKPPVESNPQLSIYDQMSNLYNEKYLDFANQFKKNNTNYITQNPTYINLTAGRFNTGKVPSYTIDATIASAQRQGIPVGKALALIGRESGFGVGPKANQWRAGNLQGLASSWNPAKDLNYHPYELMRFLADRQVPGIKTIKNDRGWFYEYDDKTGGQKAMIEYVNSHPNLLNRYKKIIDKTKPLGNLTAIDLGLMKMRRDGVANYNPGDKRYEGMYNLDYDLLKKDPALQQYLKSKGLVYRKGGLLNIYNQGGELEEDKEMVEGIADILSQVKNRENRSQIAKNMIGDFKREDIKYNLNKFLSMSNLMKKGGEMIKRADGSYSKRGLWDNIRANAGSGKAPTEEMLRQEKIIKRESKEIGGIFMGQKLFRPRKSSIFATGGMTSMQAYNFLFEGDDDDMYDGNNAPDTNEVNTLKAENKKLTESIEAQNEINERLNRQLRRSNSYAAAMDEVNRPFTYNEGSKDYSTIPDDPGAWDLGNGEESTAMQNWKQNNPYNNNLSWKQSNPYADMSLESMFSPETKLRISSPFGWRNMDKKNHNGIDIAIGMNTDIYAPISGVVNNVWNTKDGGLQVSITSATGERFGFAHLNGTPLKIGSKVNQGDLIAKSGTGGTGPHLHFTVTDANGNKVDPVKYFGYQGWNMRDRVPEYKSSKK